MRLAAKWATAMGLLGYTITAVTPVVAGTISGAVNTSTGAPLAGAVVATSGSPVYSSVTGSDGHYSVSVPGTQANWVVTASAGERDPQRVAVSLAAGASSTVNFALRASDTTGQLVNLPAPVRWGEPPSAPSAPGDNYPVAFSSMSAVPGANVPVVSMWSETVKPDESFTMTGSNFTTRVGDDAGTDTIVWVWARTSSSGGVLRQAKIWKVTESLIMATIPDDVPFGMYLVWAENANGASLPVCINRTTASWIGPIDNTIAAGQTKRVFGRNLTYNRTVTPVGSADPMSAHVYIQPSAGGAFIPCPATDAGSPSVPNLAEPYAVAFTVPAGTPNGNYKLFVHSGHGGAFGWSDGLDLVVKTPWVRGSGQLTLSPRGSGLDDTAAIQAAIETVSGYANGGTVKLTSGNFILRGSLFLRTSVELRGGGMNSTSLLLQAPPNGSEANTSPSYTPCPVNLHGNNICLSDLTINEVYGYGLPAAQLNVPTSVSGTVLSNIRVVSDQGDDNWRNLNAICWLGFGTEVRGCEFWREFDSQGRGWIHDTVSYGDVGPWYLSEAAFRLYWDRNILENNHVETKDWPVGADGTRNYNWWDHYYKKWAKRVSYVYCIDSYIAHNTSKDVAVEDNMGEMLLAHGHNCLWYGQVLSNSGLTMTVRTDGLVNGQPLTLPTYNASDPNPVVGGPIPTGPSAWLWWMDVAPRSVVIQAGKGIGQVRRIVSATSNTITIDTPWLVEPDVTSIVSFSGFWENNIIYQNELNAFPVNYQQGNGTASVAIDHDGASYHNMAEGNLSRRTNTGRAILGTAQTGCYWNEMRDEIALDCHMGGYRIIDQFVNPVGTTLIGNAYRNCSGNVYEAVSMGVVDCAGMGTIVEDANVSAQIGYFLGGDIPYIPQSQTASVLYRNGSVAVTDSPREAVHVAKIVGDGMLVNNSYAGVTQPYFYETGISGYTSPKPLQRVAKFTGYVGHSVQDVLIPIANAGTMPMTWTVATSDPWITATVQANPVLSAESTAGRLVIGVNSDGLPTGRTLGSVTVNTGGTSAKIGVCVDILAGSPPNQAPVAVFTTSVAAGTAPITVSMDAGASYDADGTITSYYWDFGDGTYGTGATTSHEYAAEGTFTPILTVTDSFGLTGQAWKNVDVSKSLTNVTLSGSPTGVIDAGTIVTLTANANGGYQTKYKFLINSANGWVTLRDYQSANTCTWTPTEIGYYEIRVCAKASDSLRAYDVMSEMLTYPVGQIPNSGLVLWLKADTGISKDGSAVYAWADQSGANNNVSQYTDAAKRPTLVTDAASGRPAVEFAGGNQSLNTLGLVLSGTTAFTTFEVLKFNSVPANTYQYAWWNGQDSIAGGYGSSVSGLSLKLRMAWGSSDKAVTFADALALQQWYRMSSRYQGTTHQAWMNGSYIGQSSKYGSNFIGGFFSLGNFGPSSTKGLFGDIGEVLIYNRALTDTERASVDTYLTARWSPAAPRSIDKLRDVAALGDGVPVSITSAKVAVVASGIYTDGSVYVIEPDRTYGLKVTGAGSIAIWENLILTGVVDADQVTGEKVLRVSTVSKSAGTELNNLGMANKIVTASGQLVRVWGKVKEKTSSYITLDDGSGSPVRVQIDGLTTPMAVSAAVGNYMSATGPCGYMAGGVMAVRVRSGSDIRVY